MKALKWNGIGAGGFAALIGAVVALVFLLTAGAASATDEFLALVGKDQYEEAYRSTAPIFRKDTSLADFRATMKHYSIDKFESASWNSREIGGGKAQLQGTIRTRDSATMHVIVRLVKIDDAWKVYGMSLDPAGAG